MIPAMSGRSTAPLSFGSCASGPVSRKAVSDQSKIVCAASESASVSAGTSASAASIAQQITGKKLPQVTDIRDESDLNEPTRIVIDKKRGVERTLELLAELVAPETDPAQGEGRAALITDDLDLLVDDADLFVRLDDPVIKAGRRCRDWAEG